MPFRNILYSANALPHTAALVLVSSWRASTQLQLTTAHPLTIEIRRGVRDGRSVNLRDRSASWLRRNRPSPYIILYEAIEAQAPQVLPSYSRLVFDGDFYLGRPLSSAPTFAPTEVQDAVLLVKPNTASLLAKVIRRSRLISQELAKSGNTFSKAANGSEAAPDLSNLMFNRPELSYMRKNGYTLDNLIIWASIILEPQCDMAVTRLNNYMFGDSSTGTKFQPRLVPVTLISVLLRRRALSSRSLQVLLTCLWHVLRFRPHGTARAQQYLHLFHTFCGSAMRTWPECLPNLASLLIAFLPRTWIAEANFSNAYANLDLDTEDVFRPEEDRRSVLTEGFNAAICALAASVGPHPFRSSLYQEKAQFMLLSHMVCYDPPLPVAGQAFAALAQVQLKRSKTVQEQQWSALQSRAWPPYPKPKTAMDEDKGYEFGSSRAIRTLQHMRQAGYALSDWERVARIFAGWDTDFTPTIQTRVAYMSQAIVGMDMENEAKAWAARIATTRDLREAWASFLHYQNAQLPPSALVYFQVFRKIREENRRLEAEIGRPKDHNLVFGAAKEVHPPASSPMQQVFLSTEPMSFMQLFQLMLQENITMPSWMLGQMLGICPSIENAMLIWSESKHSLSQVPLWEAAKIPLTCDPHMNQVEFRGFVKSLCLRPSASQLFDHFDAITKAAVRANILDSMQPQMPTCVADFFLRRHESYAIWYAIWLVKTRQPLEPSLWQELLQGLLRLFQDLPVEQRLPIYWLFGPVTDIFTHMMNLHIKPEEEIFYHLCSFMERAGSFAIRHTERISGQTESNHTFNTYAHAVDMLTLSQGSLVLRKQFARLCVPLVHPTALERSTAGTKAESWVPRTTTTLSPLTCQQYVRALAIYGDFEGLYSFARWLASHESDMVASLKQVARASERWAVVLTAFRIALESPEHMFQGLKVERLKKPSPDLAALIRGTLESMTELGGWATNEQVEDYALFVRMKAAERTHEKRYGAVMPQNSSPFEP